MEGIHGEVGAQLATRDLTSKVSTTVEVTMPHPKAPAFTHTLHQRDQLNSRTTTKLDLIPRSNESATRRPVAATTLFQVPFASAMSDPDIALLVRTLDLTAHVPPKARGAPPALAARRPASPGAIRLDHHSGLFLEHGPIEGQWVLEARTWGHPAPESVHEWEVLAAGAARLLDPVVTLPERRTNVSPEYPMRLPERAANKRLAGFRRRITGL